LVADRTHVVPPAEIVGSPALERALKLFVGRESDVVRNDVVVVDLDEPVGGHRAR